jgi:hypothetical protein
VIVPATDRPGTLGPCLDAIGSSADSPEEVLVVDEPAAAGPAAARNAGAEHARGDVLVFVDSDVVVGRQALGRLRAAFEDPGLTAVFGAYEPRADGGTVSAFRNLLHHHVHASSAGRPRPSGPASGPFAATRSARAAASTPSATRGRRSRTSTWGCGYPAPALGSSCGRRSRAAT